MKKLTLTLMLLCALNANAQYTTQIKRDTIEILTYDSLGNEIHYNPPRRIVKYTEIRDLERWESKRKRDKRWSWISFGLWTIGTAFMLFITIK